MNASLCRTLRTLGIWMLGLAVPLAACASAPVRPAAGESAAIGVGSGLTPAVSATARHRFKTYALEGFAPELTTPAKSAGHGGNRRSSAEDTTTPAPDALEAVALRVAVEPEARPRPAPWVRRSSVASPATRQRAP